MGTVPRGSPGGFHGTPSPGFNRPAPSWHSPSPGFRSPAPSWQSPSPGFRNPPPGIRNPAPGFRNPTPGFRNPAPGYRNPAPGFRHPTPGFRRPAPGFRPGGGNWGVPERGWRHPGWHRGDRDDWGWHHNFGWGLWFWPAPPFPWYWQPAPAVIGNWWYWAWWEPLPIDVQYYYIPTPDYSYEYYPYSYSYSEPEPSVSPQEYTPPESSQPYRDQSNVPKINSEKDYEQWLMQTLNLTDTQQKVFLPKLRELAQLRKNFVDSSTTLGKDIQNLQKADPTSAELTAKQEQLQNSELNFRKNEQKLMNQLMTVLTVEQRDTFMSQMKQYTPGPSSNEDTQTE